MSRTEGYVKASRTGKQYGAASCGEIAARSSAVGHK